MNPDSEEPEIEVECEICGEDCEVVGDYVVQDPGGPKETFYCTRHEAEAKLTSGRNKGVPRKVRDLLLKKGLEPPEARP